MPLGAVRLLLYLTCLLLAGCTLSPFSMQPSLRHTDFQAMQGWQQDKQQQALQAFVRSCSSVPAKDIKVQEAPVTTEAWQEACRFAAMIAPYGSREARLFFERYFTPYRVCSGWWDCDGLFTGYFEPALHGSLQPTARYRYPVYAPPEEKENLPDRAAIDAGALAGKGLEIAWVDDPVALFFLQVQGSGRLLLDDGSQVRLGYAGKNGHRYHAIGRTLIERGELSKETVSAPAIVNWLHNHPRQMWEVMQTNPSYVFFRINEEEGPIGAEGVALTAERSLAIDKTLWPYGLPFWLETTVPAGETENDMPYRQLLIGQDTGGAIRGAVRGDIFFGYGKEAAYKAGHMKQQGGYVVLLPGAYRE